MALEWTQQFLYPLIDIAAILSLVFAVKTLFHIRRQDKHPEFKTFLSKVFLLFSIGLILWVIAELGWDVWTLIVGQNPPDVSGFDIFWVAGYLVSIAAIAYFNIFMLKQHGNLKKGLLTLIIAALLTSVAVYFLITYVVVPGVEEGTSFVELFIYYFYPIAAATFFVLSVSIYFFFNQIKAIKIPLLMIAIAIAIGFVGEVLFTYYAWNDIYGWPGVLSDICYALDYILWAVALYLFSSSSSSDISKEKAKEKGEKKIAGKDLTSEKMIASFFI
ncbi:MAG: hypothetical protein KJ574_05305 [Nanoarchaeota archaeon]|nr:hypothetical protein [Nanoarchaeota archaeon]